MKQLMILVCVGTAQAASVAVMQEAAKEKGLTYKPEVESVYQQISVTHVTAEQKNQHVAQKKSKHPVPLPPLKLAQVCARPIYRTPPPLPAGVEHITSLGQLSAFITANYRDEEDRSGWAGR
jgi:hypothetical protein